ncbi:hemagglutinin repeat-containing protein [uncultured Cardiobacterium sp.]|uniref:hemagglutinin repeat-containing protein n=1 Tax=uncultured Cardiobacterium sp. TaxID=417619 RepID=UPI002606A134|nr:hemagglutinin repeat-containing protein [uncultured Cardiobacterium sp.]
MTTTAKPAQRTFRLRAKMTLLPVLLACLSSCHSITVEGKKTFAADSVHKTIESSQHSGGGGGGIAIMWGPNGGGFGFTANANIGKGETNGNSTTYRLSHIGGLQGHTDIGDGKTLLSGAQLLGKSLEGNTRELVAISPQGTMDYDSNNFALSGYVLYGYGFSAGLDYEKTRVTAHEKTINKESGSRNSVDAVEGGNDRSKNMVAKIRQNDAVANAQQDTLGGQSGFFAGDDGFRIKNSGTATLEGATFVSTEKAEAEGKNHFSTDRLIRKDLENHSEYQGKSIAIGLNFALGGNKDGGQQQQLQWLGENFSPINVGESGLSNRFGYDRTNKNDRGTTYASINTANITINDAAGQQALTGESVADTIRNANRGMTLATAKAQSGAADAHFDAAKVENSVRTNAQVMKTFTGTVQEAKGELRKRAEKNRREAIYQRDPEKRAAQLQRAEQQEQLAVAVDMLGGALTPANSVAGGIANTLAPAITYKIGQEAKQRGLEGTPEHIALHAVMAGARTALNGGSTGEVLASAAITGTAEYSAPQLAKLLYDKDISQLTAAEKSALGQTIGALTTGAGAMTGGNSATTYNAGKTAQNAVENNYMASLRDYDKKPKVIQEHTDKLLAAGAMPFEKLDEKYENCNTDKDCQNAVEEEWRKESKKTAILEKELVEKGELELKHLNGYPSTKEQKDELYSSQMVRSANRSKTALGQREAMSWNTIGKPQEADEALAIAISRNDDRLGLTEREREKWNAIAASSPGDLMANNNGLATRPLLTPKVEKDSAQIQAPAPKTESARAEGKYRHPDLNIGKNRDNHNPTQNFELVGTPYLK